MRQAKAADDDASYKRVEAIIDSMTPDERRSPEVIGPPHGAHREGERHRSREVNRSSSSSRRCSG